MFLRKKWQHNHEPNNLLSQSCSNLWFAAANNSLLNANRPAPPATRCGTHFFFTVIRLAVGSHVAEIHTWLRRKSCCRLLITFPMCAGDAHRLSRCAARDWRFRFHLKSADMCFMKKRKKMGEKWVTITAPAISYYRPISTLAQWPLKINGQ